MDYLEFSTISLLIDELTELVGRHPDPKYL
jgi:hypothetical protein